MNITRSSRLKCKASLLTYPLIATFLNVSAVSDLNVIMSKCVTPTMRRVPKVLIYIIVSKSGIKGD